VTVEGGVRFDWSKVRGFNYQPSFGRNGLEIWIDAFDAEAVDRELGLGRRCFPKMNAVRLWLSHDAFLKAPESFVNHFEATLRSCEKYGMLALPVLFNNWHSVPDFGGISTEMIGYWFADFGQKGESPTYVFRPYLEAMFQGYGSDQRVLAWDLCNEPFNNGREPFVNWLNHTYYLAKKLGAQQSIGVSVAAAIGDLQTVEPFSDVLMVHPYFADRVDWGPLQDLSQKRAKPLLATECCWGALDDARRVAIIRSDLDALAKQNVGFLAHALCESPVADLHRPQFGVMSSAEYMAFIHREGILRPGHVIFNEYCQ
jgi:hypothetical protein